MYNVSQAFLDSLEHNGRQYVIGTINLPDGETIYLDDKNLVGSPEYSRQCTADADIFAVGQLHSGTAKLTVRMPEFHREQLRGGRLKLEFRVENADDFVPLGVWTITEPTRREKDFIEIVAEDCISRLDVPINDKYVGLIEVSARMKKVTELTGVTFAQTAAEIEELMNTKLYVAGTSFCRNCREEVSAIAKFIGGIAYADRFGHIAFRKFGSEPVLTIRAERRHKISLAEYTFGIRGVAYTDSSGYTTAVKWSGTPVNTAAVVGISDVPYIWDSTTGDEAEADKQYKLFLEGTAENLHLPSWTPGEVEYYGNPALDLGDIVALEGGINGNETALFLITGDNWRFRGAQTLISAGADAASAGSSSSSSVGASQIHQLITQVNVEKNIAAVEMTGYAGVLAEKLKIAAAGAFSVREQTVVFVDITANIRSLGNTEVRLNLLYDGIKQTVHAVETMAANERRTIHFTAHLTAAAGKHTVTIEGCGNAETERITAVIWGQNIAPEKPEPAYAADYEYTVNPDGVTIDKYIGDSDSPTVPREIEGRQVNVIGSRAFMGTSVKSVHISEGVEEIQ